MASLTKNLNEKLKEIKELEKSVLFIDQLEEVITLCNDFSERDKLLETLNELLSISVPEFKIIFTVRADFEPQIANWFPSQQWAEARYVVPPFTSQELKEIITQPATQRVLLFEPPELVQIILDEVQQQQGILPLLSFTLSELYEAYIKDKSAANNRALTLANYKKLGGVIGSLQHKANELYQ